jgi:hypothetical protein
MTLGRPPALVVKTPEARRKTTQILSVTLLNVNTTQQIPHGVDMKISPKTDSELAKIVKLPHAKGCSCFRAMEQNGSLIISSYRCKSLGKCPMCRQWQLLLWRRHLASLLGAMTLHVFHGSMKAVKAMIFKVQETRRKSRTKGEVIEHVDVRQDDGSHILITTVPVDSRQSSIPGSSLDGFLKQLFDTAPKQQQGCVSPLIVVSTSRRLKLERKPKQGAKDFGPVKASLAEVARSFESAGVPIRIVKVSGLIRAVIASLPQEWSNPAGFFKARQILRDANFGRTATNPPSPLPAAAPALPRLAPNRDNGPNWTTKERADSLERSPCGGGAGPEESQRCVARGA